MIQQCAAIDQNSTEDPCTLMPVFWKTQSQILKLKSKDYNVKALVYNIICKPIHHYWYPDLSLKRKKNSFWGLKNLQNTHHD